MKGRKTIGRDWQAANGDALVAATTTQGRHSAGLKSGNSSEVVRPGRAVQTSAPGQQQMGTPDRSHDCWFSTDVIGAQARMTFRSRDLQLKRGTAATSDIGKAERSERGREVDLGGEGS